MADEVQLQNEAHGVAERLRPVFALAAQEKISAPELAGLYIVTYLQYRRPHDWLSSSLKPALQYQSATADFVLYDLPGAELLFKKSVRDRLGVRPTVGSLLAQHSLRGVPLAVNHALLNWLAGVYRLNLTHEIPSPESILFMQAEGRRCVTVISQRHEMARLVLDQRDPLGFTLHDLIHADRFFVQPELVAGQIGFSKLMRRAVEAKLFVPLLRDDPEFKKEFEYVIGDMNSYCVHMIKCLKAVCLGTYLRREGKPPNAKLSATGSDEYENFFSRLHDLWQTPAPVREALKALNSPRENKDTNHNHVIQKFFDDHGELP